MPFIVCVTDHCGATVLAHKLTEAGVPVLDRGRVPPDELPSALRDTTAAGSPAAALVRWEDLEPSVVRPPADVGAAQPRGRQRLRPGTGRQTWRTTWDEAVPGLRYVQLLRRDKWAQALEAQRAARSPLDLDPHGPTTEADREQPNEDADRGVPTAGAGLAAAVAPVDPHAPAVDADAMRLLARLRGQDWLWIGFFAWTRITPVVLVYEDLLSDPRGTVERMLAELGVADPVAGRASAPLTAAGPPSPRPLRVAPEVATAPARACCSTSIVVVSHNEGENLALTVGGIRATVPDDVDVVVVDDWSTDDSVAHVEGLGARVVRPPRRVGVSGARNIGARVAQGGDFLIFADAHVDPSPGWLQALLAAFDDPWVACAAPTITQIHQRSAQGHGFTWNEPQLRMRWLRSTLRSTHEVPFICGCLMAFRRQDFETVGGFDDGLVRWGSEDAEIGLHLWRRHRASVVVPDAVVGHLFRPVGPYDVPSELVVHNALRLASVHLPTTAVERVIEGYRRLPTFPAAYSALVDSDAWTRRDRIAADARHDGAWFLDRFRIEALR